MPYIANTAYKTPTKLASNCLLMSELKIFDFIVYNKLMEWLMLMTIQIYMSTATDILYVLPDNSTDAVSCPSQPCATLSQYLLDNGTLPVVSNVEYHFLPGEHHVPANMILQDLHNFSIIGTVHNLPSSVVLVGCLQWYVINIIHSHFVSINNVVFKHCSIWEHNRKTLTSLKLSCCFSCKIANVTFIQYGIIGINLIGKSYLHNIKFETMQLSLCQGVHLRYSTCLSWSNYNTHMHSVTINQLLIFNQTKCSTHTYGESAGLYIGLEHSAYHITILINNSYFHIMDRTALRIKNRYLPHTVQKFFVTNCTFKSIDAGYAIDIFVSPYNKIIYFVNCDFQNNKELIRITVEVCRSHICFSSTKLPAILTNICFIRCHFIKNSHELLTIENRVALLGKIHLLLESLSIFHNFHSLNTIKNIISVSAANVHINGTFNVTKNHCRLSIMQLQSCDILFSGKIIFDNNYCAEVFSLDTYIKVLEYTNITIINNRYQNVLISLESAVGYYQPHAFCLFQYVATKVTNNTLTNYAISFLHNHKTLNVNNLSNLMDLYKLIIVQYQYVIFSFTASGYHHQYFITKTLKLLINKLFKTMNRIVTIISTYAIAMKEEKLIAAKIF